MPKFVLELELRVELIVEAACEEEVEDAAIVTDLDSIALSAGDWEWDVCPYRPFGVEEPATVCIRGGELVAITDQEAEAATEEGEA